MPERGGGMPITPRKAKTGRIPPMEHRANAHRSLPRMPQTGGRHANYALKGQKKHTLCAPAAPVGRTPETRARTGGRHPGLRSRLGLQPASNTTPRTPSSRMRTCPQPGGRAGRPHLPLSSKKEKRGTSPPMEHGRNQKAETSPPDGAKKGWENMKSGH